MGDNALLIEFDAVINPRVNRQVRSLMAGLTNKEMSGIVEMVPAYRSLLIHYDPCRISTGRLCEQVYNVGENLDRIAVPKAHKFYLPVCYDDSMGPDLAYVAQYHHLTKEAVIAIHSSKDYLVYMIGFLAGFPYLGEIPEQIATPRLTEPRTKIPVGSVGIAGKQTGIYPLESPGGWRIIGRTPIELYTPQRDPPTLLSAGDCVRFVPVSQAQFQDIKKRMESGSYQVYSEEMANGN